MNKLESLLNAPVNLAGWTCLKVANAEPHSDTWSIIVGLGLIPLVIGLNVFIYFLN